MQKILLVEDNLSDSKIMTFILEKKGYQVHCAEDAYATMDILRRYPIDVVLLDWMLPHVNGIDILKTIRQDAKHRRLPVIFTTSRADSRDIKRAADAGVTDYIVKPIDADLLENKLRRILTQNETHRLFTIPNPQDRKAELSLDIQILTLSESKVQLISEVDFPKNIVLTLDIPLFLKLGIRGHSLKISGSIKNENNYFLEGHLIGLDNEDLYKLRVYLKSIED